MILISFDIYMGTLTCNFVLTYVFVCSNSISCNICVFAILDGSAFLLIYSPLRFLKVDQDQPYVEGSILFAL